MKIVQHEIAISTPGRSATEITAKVREVIANCKINTGLCHLFLQHTSASLMICENYDIQVRKDLENFLSRLIPDGDPMFKHTLEGEDDMPAHIRTILTQTEMNIPITEGCLTLGTWQGIFLYEHRYAAQQRHIILTIMGQ